MVSAESEEMVLIPVPKGLYNVVIQAIAGAAGSQVAGPAQEIAEAGSRTADAKRPWTRDEIRRLKQLLRAPGRIPGRNETLIALFDVTASQPGQALSFKGLLEQTGRAFGQARADLGGLTRLCMDEFGRSKQDAWPLSWETAESGQVSYRMTDEIAQWWLEG